MPPDSVNPVLLFTTYLFYALGLIPEIATPLAFITGLPVSFVLRLLSPFFPFVFVVWPYLLIAHWILSPLGPFTSLFHAPSCGVMMFIAVAAVLSLLWRQRVLRMQSADGPFRATRGRTSHTLAPAAAAAAPSSGRGRPRGPARGGRGRGRAGQTSRRSGDADDDPHTDPHTDPNAHSSFPHDAPDSDEGARHAVPSLNQFVTRDEMGELLQPVRDERHTLHSICACMIAPRSRRARSPSVSEDEQYESESDDDNTPPVPRKHNKKKKQEPFSLPSAGLDLDSNKSARDRHTALAELSQPMLKIQATITKMARDPTIPRGAVHKLDKHASGALDLLRSHSLNLLVGTTLGWQAVEHMQRMAHLPSDVRSVLKSAASFAKPPPQPCTRPSPSPFIPRMFPSRAPPPSTPIFSNDFSFAPPPSVRPPFFPPPFPLLGKKKKKNPNKQKV